MSANTPAGNEKRNIGKNTAVCTRAAKNDDPVNCNIVQAAAIICMALPTKYRAPPVNRPRKAGTRRVCQMEVLARVSEEFAFGGTVATYSGLPNSRHIREWLAMSSAAQDRF